MPSVNQGNGKVENLAALKAWKPANTIETILQELKKEMINNKKLAQPAEGASYWLTVDNHWLR